MATLLHAARPRRRVAAAFFAALVIALGGLLAVGPLRRAPQSYSPRSSATVSANPPVPFTSIVIDPALAGVTTEKGVADLDGDGRLDVVVGFEQPGAGLVWYEFPHSGNPRDHWIRHTITPSGTAYEDLAPVDLDGDGRLDVVASINGDIVWFRNPGPTTSPWQQHRVGGGHGENNMALADLDGDGRVDIATNRYVFFQDSPTWWVRIEIGRAFRGTALLDIGSGRGAVNLVTNARGVPDAVWYENPREHGGNARTDRWVAHTIGPTYECGPKDTCKSDDVANFATADVNGDGRMDVVGVQSEGDFAPPPGGLRWWEAPVDRTGPWTAHVVDATFESAHNVVPADINGDGAADLVAAEQEQSPGKRVSVFLNDGHGRFSQEVLSTGSGHDPVVADVDGDGRLDIVNSPHGFFGAPRVLTLYLNGS